MEKQNGKRENFIGVRVNDDELKTIDELARRLERKRGDAIRVVLRRYAPEFGAAQTRADAVPGEVTRAIAG